MPVISTPGSDGVPVDSSKPWRKGIVYTTRPAAADSYRIVAGFKRRAPAAGTGYGELYRRVTRVAEAALMRTARIGEGKPAIVCQGWRSFGEGDAIAAAFLALEVGAETPGQAPPSAVELLSPGGATLEELARQSPQRAEEFYNEFDFTTAANPEEPVVVSYGERVGSQPVPDFQPFLERAERFADFYRGLLEEFGESGAALRLIRREWFEVSHSNLVTVQLFLRA